MKLMAAIFSRGSAHFLDFKAGTLSALTLGVDLAVFSLDRREHPGTLFDVIVPSLERRSGGAGRGDNKPMEVSST